MSVVSILIFIISITVLAFTFNTSPDIKANDKLPQGCMVNVHLIGCNDCSGVGYCIDNGVYTYVGACDFNFEVQPGSYVLCVVGVNCATVYNSGASAKINCADGGENIEIKIDCTHPCDCTCDNYKKKK